MFERLYFDEDTHQYPCKKSAINQSLEKSEINISNLGRFYSFFTVSTENVYRVHNEQTSHAVFTDAF